MKNTKKGFTLVELLVVIAIVAILATVAVIGYTSFTRKAEISNDSVIAKELTTLIQATDINDPVESFDDVMNVLRANGFLIPNLNTKTEGCYFVWDKETNQILLVDGKDGYKVLFPEGYAKEPSANWYVAIADKAGYTQVVADLGSRNVNVMPTIGTTSDLADMLDTLTSGTVYIDEGLVLSNTTSFTFDNEGSVITLDIGDNTVSSPVLDEVPFLLNAGTLNVVGGDISSLGSWVDSDGRTQTSAFVAYEGAILNVKDAKITSNEGIPFYFRGADGSAENVTATAKTSAISVRTATVTIKDCNVTSTDDRAIWVTASYESGKFEGNAEVTINGGTYSAATSTIGVFGTNGDGYQAGYKAIVTILDGTFSSGDGKFFKFYEKGAEINIKGGTFGEYTFDELKAMEEDDAIEILTGMTNGTGVSIVKNADGSFTLSK